MATLADHIITMVQALNHYEKISSRSHSNYLAQISIEMTQTNNEMNDVLSKLTALGSILVPMNLVTGLWGMNVLVPGQYQASTSRDAVDGFGLLTYKRFDYRRILLGLCRSCFQYSCFALHQPLSCDIIG